MGIVLTKRDTCKNIADVIREKTNTESEYTLGEMSEALREAWDAHVYNIACANGTRTNYEEGFWKWSVEYIRPPFVIRPTSRSIECFCYNSKLKKIEKKYFDFSNCSVSNTSSTGGHYYICYGCVNLEVFEDIGLQPGRYNMTWGDCPKLHTIELIRSARETLHDNPFHKCSGLINVRFEGEIGQNIRFGDCSKLSQDSINDIIDHLADLTGEEQKTITWHSTVSSNLTTEQLTKIQNKNWKMG